MQIDNRDQIKLFLEKYNLLDTYKSVLRYRYKCTDYKTIVEASFSTYTEEMTYAEIINNWDNIISYNSIWSRVYFLLPTEIDNKPVYLIDIDLYKIDEEAYQKILNAIPEEDLIWIFDSPFGHHILVNNECDALKQVREEIKVSLFKNIRNDIVLYSKDVSTIDPKNDIDTYMQLFFDTPLYDEIAEVDTSTNEIIDTSIANTSIIEDESEEDYLRRCGLLVD